jgi:hypothetical protein
MIEAKALEYMDRAEALKVSLNAGASAAAAARHACVGLG